MRIDTKITKRGRGRPRAYDREGALRELRATFLEEGFAAASLDRIADATQMNRPSLYAAFGDKEAMYLAALAQFADEMNLAVSAALAAPTLRNALTQFYFGAIDQYTADVQSPKGCFVVCTATVAAPANAQIKAALAEVLLHIDAVLAQRVTKSIQEGELDKVVNAKALARVLAAVLHSLAVRARSGESRRNLRRMATDAIELALLNN